MTVCTENTRGNRTDARLYLFILFCLLYFIILFGERTAAVIVGFVSENTFTSGSDPAQWYAHIVTLVSLAASLVAAFVNGRAFVFLFTRSACDYSRISLRGLAVTCGLVLAGGMAHTQFTLLWLQFVAYGFFFIGLLMRTLAAGTKGRPDVSVPRLAVSFAYLLCFSMAIPVVYPTGLADIEIAFVTVEAVTALVLVAAFTRMTEIYCRSGGLINFGIPVILFTVAADIALIVMRAPETLNVFVAVFLALTVILWLVGRIAYGEKVLPYFGGRYAGRRYFEGWYVKMTAGDETVAAIVSYHVGSNGDKYGMIQFACEGGFSVRIPEEEFEACEDKLSVRAGSSTLTAEGLSLDVSDGVNSVKGEVRFGAFTPPRRDIMGPFASFPFMECKHGVLSMMHGLSGSLNINGRMYSFDGGTGYIEKDLGRSFPSQYLWTQGSDGSSSVMAAIARIPYLGMSFGGCICFVYTGGSEYRLATYNFAKAEKNEKGFIVKRGKYRLEIITDGGETIELAAPSDGDMKRRVRERVSARIRYIFKKNENVLLDMTCKSAGYEEDR